MLIAATISVFLISTVCFVCFIIQNCGGIGPILEKVFAIFVLVMFLIGSEFVLANAIYWGCQLAGINL